MGAAGAGEGEPGIGGQVSERMSLAPYRTATAESARWTPTGVERATAYCIRAAALEPFARETGPIMR